MRSTVQYAFLLPFDIHLTHHILFFDQHLDNKVDSDDNHNNNNGDDSDDDGSVVDDDDDVDDSDDDGGDRHWSGLTNICICPSMYLTIYLLSIYLFLCENPSAYHLQQ